MEKMCVGFSTKYKDLFLGKKVGFFNGNFQRPYEYKANPKIRQTTSVSLTSLGFPFFSFLPRGVLLTT